MDIDKFLKEFGENILEDRCTVEDKTVTIKQDWKVIKTRIKKELGVLFDIRLLTYNIYKEGALHPTFVISKKTIRECKEVNFTTCNQCGNLAIVYKSGEYLITVCIQPPEFHEERKLVQE